MRASEQNRPDVQAQRAEWVKFSTSAPLDTMVFLDESAASTSLARLCGRALAGERLRGSAPAGHWLTCTMLCAIRRSGPFAPALIDGPVNGDVFLAWVEQTLIPGLRPGEIVVMDNLSAHRMTSVAATIRAAGFEVRYLPPYSPDFNPIEFMWSQVKSVLRKLAARTFDDLCEAMGKALDAVTPGHCADYFNECGYHVT
jgi:transposase